jgi:DoxX-like family
MSVLDSPKTYAALAAFHAGDAVACAVQVPYITKILDDVEVPKEIRWVFPVVKAAAAVGLASVYRFPALARLTTALLTVYFVLAVGAHLRVRDRVVNVIPAAAFLATFGAMTVKGPPRSS